MKVVDIATEIYLEQGEPTDVSLASIAYWIRAKIGYVNNLLCENFAIDPGTYEVVDGDSGFQVYNKKLINQGISVDNGRNEITIEAAAIIKKLYQIYYYDIQIKELLGALSTDTLLRVEDQGSVVQKINRNDIIKTLAGLKKDEIASCNTLVGAYKIRKSGPQQVAGDDTEAGIYLNSDILLTDRNWVVL